MSLCETFGHSYGDWSSQILECPDKDEIATWEVWTHACKTCGHVEASEEVLSCPE